jgi:mono/diheme cytochrome c family protein
VTKRLEMTGALTMTHTKRLQWNCASVTCLAVLLAGACNRPSPDSSDTSHDPATTAAAAPPPTTTTTATTNRKRGEHLATIFTCTDCHSERAADGVHPSPYGTLAGGRVYSGPFGTIHTPNLTVLGPAFQPDYLDKDIRGQNRNFAVMPSSYFNTIAKDDMRDLVTFLHGLTPVNHEAPSDERSSSWAAPPPNAPVAVPDRAPTGRSAARGEYLATVTGCGDCHTPKTLQGVDDHARLFAGGGKQFPGPDGGLFDAPNLTPDQATGLASWSDVQIISAIREGKGRDGHVLHPAMPYGAAYSSLTDDEVSSVVLYLRTLKPVTNALPRNPVWQVVAR